MTPPAHDRARLLSGFGISILVHVLLIVVMPLVVLAGGSEPLAQDRERWIDLPPLEQEPPLIGMEGGRPDTQTWLGFEDPTEHSARQAETEQSLLEFDETGTEKGQAGTGPGEAPPAEPTPQPTNPAPQPTPPVPVTQNAAESPAPVNEVLAPVETAEQPAAPAPVPVESPPTPEPEIREPVRTVENPASTDPGPVEPEPRPVEATEVPTEQAETPVETPEPTDSTAEPVRVERPAAIVMSPIERWNREQGTPTLRRALRGSGAPADRQALATAIEEAIEFRPGRAPSAEGMRLKPVAPAFSHFNQLTVRPDNPVARLLFRADGNVEDVIFLRGSGSRDVDRNVEDALYEWEAEGERLDKLRETFGLPDPDAPEDEIPTIAVDVEIIL
ncbi:MAG: hypothetical protein AAGD00_06335 [Planctomycetota bacterium]